MSDNTERQVEIRDDPDEGAYVIDVDGERAGKAVYHMRGGRHLFVHTEIADDFSGMGLGTRLVRFALDDVRSGGGLMVPICPFFASYIERHPEYEDIVDHDLTDRVNRNREQSS
ncbi:MAG: GNAT family N-acetyltransferase [Acidimicrobiia bacterium]